MKTIRLFTKGFTDIIDITPLVHKGIEEEKFQNGVVHLFVVGSTASLTTSERDENVFEDIREVLENIAPYGKNWRHHQTWGDDNGAAHIRATLLGPSLCIPVKESKLLLGTWQKIILIDFDTREREREIIMTFIKE